MFLNTYTTHIGIPRTHVTFVLIGKDHVWAPKQGSISLVQYAKTTFSFEEHHSSIGRFGFGSSDVDP